MPFWIVAGIAAIGAAGITKAYLLPTDGRNFFDAGLVQTLSFLERALSLGGLGLAIGTMDRRYWVPLLIFGGAVLGGLAGESSVLSTFASWPYLWRLIELTGPIGCVAVGLTLLLPAFIQKWLLFLASVIFGAGVGLTTAVSVPADDPSYGFAVGAVLGAVWSVFFALAMALIVKNLVPLTWFVIGVRIAGSWLIAIGLLLIGLQNLPPKISGVPALSLSPASVHDQLRQP